MNPCLFQSPAGAASTFEPFRIPVLATLYTAPSRSFGVRLVHREWSYGLSWVSPFRLCLPSPCALIIAEGRLLVKGFSEVSENFLSSPRYLTLWGGTARAVFQAPDQISGDGRQSLEILGRSPTARLVLRHYGVPLLGYDGRPSEGLGFASPPDSVILSHYRVKVNPFLRFFLKKFFFHTLLC